MRKMIYLILSILALSAMCFLIMGCHSCYRGTNAANDLRKSKGVPAVIADAKLLRYKYTLQGTMRWPLHSEYVEICEEDSTRCVILLFDESRIDSMDFDANGEPILDSLIVSSEVLDSIKQMIIDAKAWRFKDNYSPRMETLDGNSWGYSATFAVTDSMLAATPEAQRQRLLRHGGCNLSSGGSNASPDTKLFEQVRLYLLDIYESQKAK